MAMAPLVKVLHNKSSREELLSQELAVPTHEPSTSTLPTRHTDLAGSSHVSSSKHSSNDVKSFNPDDTSLDYTCLEPIREELSQDEGRVNHIVSAANSDQPSL